MPFKLEIITPDRVVFSGNADFVSVRGVEGELGIMPGHIPLFTKLLPELVTVHQEGRKEVVAAMGGFLDVHPDRVTILSDAAELASEIDVARARSAKERAEEKARHNKDLENEAALVRAVVRLRASEVVGGATTRG
jgi:F-type H+-transporting ATPase subunit epsilon